MKFKNLLFIILLAVLSNTLSWAGEFEDSAAAYHRQDYKTVLRLLSKLAQQGHVLAQYNLGKVYYHGEVAPQDYAEALKWYRLAAQQGYALAQYNLGMMYNNGRGVPQNIVKAHLWFNLAASASGNANSIKGRDDASGTMTPSQISEAQKMARDCIVNKFKGCN